MTKELLQYYTDSIWTKIKALFTTKEEAVNGILVKGNRTLVETVNANTTIALPSLDTFGELYVEMHHVDGTIVHQVNINKDALLFESTNTEYREILLDGIHDAQTYVTYDIANNTIIPTYCEGVEIDETSTDVTTSVYIVSGDEMSATNLTASNITYNDGTVADALDDIVENGVKNGTELTDILPSGQTTITFTSEEITNDSKLNAVYTSIFDVQLESASFGDGTLTLVFPAQEEDMEVVALINATSTGYDIIAREVMDELNTHIGDTDNPHGVTAEQISVDNSVSGLSAENVQGAIDDCVRTLGYTKNYNSLDNTATTITKNGLTFTVNSDKSVTVVGTPTVDTFIIINTYTEKQGNHILSGCPSGGSASGYRLYCYNVSTNLTIETDLGEGVEFTLDENLEIGVSILVKSGTVMNHTFYPMIRPADIEDDTYEPYVADLKSLVCNVEKIEMIETMTTPATEARYYTYMATKKCIINLTFTACFGNTGAKVISIYRNFDTVASSYNYDGASLTATINMVLEKGDQIKCNATYTKEAENGIRAIGYVQYLE